MCYNLGANITIFKVNKMKNKYDVWLLGNKMIVFAGGGAFLGGLIAQLPGAIIGAIIAAIYASLVKPELKEDDKIDLQTDSSN